MLAYNEYLNLTARIEAEDFDEETYFEIKEKVCALASFSNETQTYKILQHALSSDSYQPYKKWVLSALPNIYRKHPVLRKKVLKILNDDYFNTHLDVFYPVAVQITQLAQDNEERICCLDKINLRINSNDNSPQTLKKAFSELGRLIKSDFPNQSYLKQIIKYAMNNPQNDEESLSQAERILDTNGIFESKAFAVKRVPKTKNYPFGIKSTKKTSIDTPCVFVLPGDATLSEKEINSYLSDIESFFESKGLKQDVAVCGCFYDFGEYMNRATAIIKQMEKYHRLLRRNTDTQEENINPKYVDQLFEQTLLPRIANKNGKRRSLNKAKKYIRNINFFAHCHGGYTFLKLEEKLQEKMTSLGYSANEQKQIFDNLLCVAFAPFAPFGVSKSKMISFISAEDEIIRQHNHAEFHIRNLARKDSFKPSYFLKKRGDCFIVSKISKNNSNHNFAGFTGKRSDLTIEGKMLINIMANVLTGGVLSSLKKTDLPSIQELFPNSSVSFETLERNGQEMWKIILQKTKDSAFSKRLFKSIHRSEEFGL